MTRRTTGWTTWLAIGLFVLIPIGGWQGVGGMEGWAATTMNFEHARDAEVTR